MKETILMARNKEKEYTIGAMEVNITENGSKIK